MENKKEIEEELSIKMKSTTPEISGKKKRMKTLSVWIAYFILLSPAVWTFGPVIMIMSIVPVVTTAALFGLRYGVMAAVVAVGYNIMTTVFLTPDLSIASSWYPNIISSGVIIFIGFTIGYLRDTSDKLAKEVKSRKKAEEELKESEQRLDSLISNTPAVIHSYKFLDGDMKLNYINDNVQNVLGFKPNDFTGHEEFYTSCIHPSDRENVLKKIQNMIQEGTDSITMTYRFKNSSGNYHWLRDTHRIISREDNETEVVGSWWDITERKQAEEREDFLHTLLRHDIRNKTQTVEGYLELMENFDLPKKAKKYLEKAKQGSRENIELINKVSTLRKAQEEQVGEVDITSVLHSAVDQVKNIAEETGMEIQTQIQHSEEGCMVKGGPIINEMFSNLLENSIRHSEGSRLRIREEVTENEVTCIIKDDGKGIPDDKKDTIFERGYTTDEERGAGLGMFLVETLLDIYGGSIEVKDSDLGGARFDIHLRKV